MENKKIYLSKPEYLKVIKIVGKTGNLALITNCVVNTEDNFTELSYKVISYNNNDNHKKITKVFNSYQEAHNYYEEVYNKYKVI